MRSGVLIIDKPSGPTSHDVVARARRALGERRIGHTGTLDPAASGVLPLVVGRATRLARFLSASDKSYEAVIRFGLSTDTGDAQGTVIGAPSHHGLPSHDALDQAIATFRGTFMQQPPAFSAKKIDGRRSYVLARARRGAPSAAHPVLSTSEPVLRISNPTAGTQHTTGPLLPSPVEVTAHAIDLLDVSGDEITLHVTCSAGFYIRSLAHDLGERLGTGAHLTRLRRTRSGDFTLGDSVALDEMERHPECVTAALVPLARMLPGLSSVVLTKEGAKHASHGRALGPSDLVSAPDVVAATSSAAAQGAGPARSISLWVRMLDQQGEMLGVARLQDSSGALHPSVVLV